ncbi:Hypothetical protein (Fragment) [Durusdinium trenchii]|uniref:Lipoxygenase domain-containing protein n=1 Tax=Durusdinium trenchii TaxID=1381693 RepID=A0ABP0P829_9DINO
MASMRRGVAETKDEEEALLEQEELVSGAGGCTKRCGACCCCTVLLLTIAVIFYLKWQRICIGPAFPHDDVDAHRPAAFVAAEALRRAAAERAGAELLTEEDLPNAFGLLTNAATGFEKPGCLSLVVEMFHRLLKLLGETMDIVSFQDYARTHFGRALPGEFLEDAVDWPVEDYYTGGRVPSWEDNEGHRWGIMKLTAVVKAARATGVDPITVVHPLEPRVAFDHRALVNMASDGFRYFGPMEVKYASNGFFGASVVEQRLLGVERGDLLGMLMTESVFGAHLVYEAETELFHVDLTDLEKYPPLPGYAALGGRASFRQDAGRLRTVSLDYQGRRYTNFSDPQVDEAYEKNNTRTGWRMAEGAFIASLLSMTNLVMHVKDLHVEICTAFQAVTVDAFAGQTSHPVRRLLDAFISRSVQATNDNLRLLYDFHAADFSLAPLPHDQQLKLIDEFIKSKPLNLAALDMEHYGQLRYMDPSWSTEEAVQNASSWGWRWHYRALTVQRLLASYVTCFLEAEGVDDGESSKDNYLKDWWQSMIFHLPALRRATEEDSAWASAELNKLDVEQLVRVLSTLMVWVSWIHEDVGHSAAAYVWNPVYTPMCVPEDGVGVPLRSWLFNAVAYRSFVFLHRSTLLDEAPEFWFGNAESKKCFQTFQETLKSLGDSDVAFRECDQEGFYSCVDRVETAVSS